jgi:catechol 2,3-dioxygenase-like lactoylglutathione lyase family enzyme
MENEPGIARHQRPRLAYLHHISLPCRDLAESKRFYMQVLGGELIHDIAGFAEVRIANIIIGMSQQSGGWTGPTVEYPHYGLNVDGTNLPWRAAGLNMRRAAAWVDAQLQNRAPLLFAIPRVIYWSFTARAAMTASASWHSARAKAAAHCHWKRSSISGTVPWGRQHFRSLPASVGS